MDRVFAGMAVGILLVLSGALVLGLLVDGSSYFVPHFALGLLGSLLATLLHVVTFTYFTVTGKAIRQAVALASLDAGKLEQVRRHKKIISRCVAFAFLPIVATVALGAMTVGSTEAATYHLASGALTLLINAWVMTIEFEHIRQNCRLLDVVMGEYRQKGPGTAPKPLSVAK